MNERLAMTLAMLGYQRWLPRSLSSSSAVKHPLPVTVVKEQVSLPAKHTPSEEGATARQVQQAASTQYLADGVAVCTQGILISDQASALAWFLPLPWPTESGWKMFRDDRESQLLSHALQRSGQTHADALLKKYSPDLFTDKYVADAALTADIPALPDGVTHVATFSGRTWRHLTQADKTEDTVKMDWQGREVQVICLPHPYRCLINPAGKRTLWQALIKMDYER